MEEHGFEIVDGVVFGTLCGACGLLELCEMGLHVQYGSQYCRGRDRECAVDCV